MSARLVYSPHYDIRFLGLERLHPFDSRKYSRAFARLDPAHQAAAEAPVAPASHQDLLTVHTKDYLNSLRSPEVIAQSLELGFARFIPGALSDRFVLRKMRWAVSGTTVAARRALEQGAAVNLSGGYHHAKPSGGEGFCVYNDIAIAIVALRSEGLLEERARVLYVDLDAHLGNGVAHAFLEDDRVLLFDMFNAQIYPADDRPARARLNWGIGLDSSVDDTRYLGALKAELIGALEASQDVKLVIYNAGTDVFERDPLGGL